MDYSEILAGLFNKEERKDYVLKILEELAELQVALTHYELGKTGRVELIDEMADVSIQLDKLVILLKNDGIDSPQKKVESVIRNKMELIWDML